MPFVLDLLAILYVRIITAKIEFDSGRQPKESGHGKRASRMVEIIVTAATMSAIDSLSLEDRSSFETQSRAVLIKVKGLTTLKAYLALNIYIVFSLYFPGILLPFSTSKKWTHVPKFWWFCPGISHSSATAMS